MGDILEKANDSWYNVMYQIVNFKEVRKMSVSYKKLWKLLIDHDMKKKDLAEKANISTYTLSKMGKGENVTTDILVKICTALECDISDIMEVSNK